MKKLLFVLWLGVCAVTPASLFGQAGTPLGAYAPAGGGPVVVTLVPFSATPTFTYSSGSQETSFSIQLTGNVTSSTMAGTFSAGSDVQFIICQDAQGARSFAYPSGFLNLPTLNTAASGCTAGTWVFCGTVGNNACPANQWQNTDQGPAGISSSFGNPPASPNGAVFIATDIPAGGVAVSAFSLTGVTWRTVSGTTDTILYTDRGNCVSYSNAGAIAVTVPQAGSANFTNGFNFCVKTTATGTATLTPQVGQIAGNNGTLSGSLAVTAGLTAYCYTDSSGANYQCTVVGTALSGATVGALQKAATSTAFGDSGCIESAGVLTCTESGGEAFPVGALSAGTNPCTGLTPAASGAGGVCAHVGGAPTGMPASTATLTPTSATCWAWLAVAVNEGCLTTGSIVQITGADWTCGTGGTVSSCVAATTIGTLTFTLPLSALNVSVDCNLIVGQATAATANSWNIQTATNGATNLTAGYSMFTAATAAANGAVTDVASTTTTQVIAPTWTLGGTATKMNAHIWGTIEGASASGTVINIQLVAPTVGDLVTIYRGSECHDRIF